MKVVALLSFLSITLAFAPSSSSRSRGGTVVVQESQEDLKELARKLNPAVRFYDPLHLSDLAFWGTTNEATIGFLRHSEIKHGRVAMAAFVGYIVHSNGYRFPWPMTLDGTPFPHETNPPALWDALPEAGKWQIIGFIGFLEFWGELTTLEHHHYMSKGGKPGKYPDFVTGKDAIPHPIPFKSLYDPFGLWKNRSEDAKERGLLVEINNGRAAMIGIFSFLSAQTAPGSVPLLNGVLPGYDGEVMAPFSVNIFELH